MTPEPLQGRHSLCKHAVRLNRDIRGLQHREKLLLKRMRGVVGGLIGNVHLDPFQLGRADAERSVAFLPGKHAICFSHLSAGVRLQGSHRIRQRHVRRHDYEHVDMVFRTAHGKHLHAVIARDARKVVPQPRLMIGANELHALFGAENNVEDGTDVAVRHVSTVPPLKGLPNKIAA